MIALGHSSQLCSFSILLGCGVIAGASSLLNIAIAQEQAAEPYEDTYFGITIQRPSGWYLEGDDPWLHSDINPWHLPLIPIKELQPTPVDILLESKKTQVLHIGPADETSASIGVFVEKMPFGTTSDSLVEHVLERMRKNNDNVRVEEMSETVIDGNPAVKLLITFGDSDNAARTMQILSLYGNLAYILQYEGSLEDYDVHLAAAQHTIETTLISPPQSRAQMLLLPMAGIGIASAAIIAIKVSKQNSYIRLLLGQTKRLLPSALGIEILCVASAEIGGILGLYYFGFNAFGITMAYAMAYALAGFTTFTSIVGRSVGKEMNHNHDEEVLMCGCSDEHGARKGFASNIIQTFTNFGRGLSQMRRLHRQPNAWSIVKVSLIVLVTAESGCIIAAATVDIMMYQYSIFLSIPSALLAGTFTVALIAARKSLRNRSIEQSNRGF